MAVAPTSKPEVPRIADMFSLGGATGPLIGLVLLCLFLPLRRTRSCPSATSSTCSTRSRCSASWRSA